MGTFHCPYFGVLLLTTAHLPVQVSVPDWLEAFRAHPRIGDASALRHSTDKFSSYSKSEQSVALQGTTSQVQQVCLCHNPTNCPLKSVLQAAGIKTGDSLVTGTCRME